MPYRRGPKGRRTTSRRRGVRRANPVFRGISGALTDGRPAVVRARAAVVSPVSAFYTVAVSTTGAGLLNGSGFSIGAILAGSPSWTSIGSVYEEFAVLSVEVSYQPRSVAQNTTASAGVGGGVIAMLPSYITPPVFTRSDELAEFRAKHVTWAAPFTVKFMMPSDATTPEDHIWINTTLPASTPGCICYAQDGTPWATSTIVGDYLFQVNLLVRGQQ